MNVKKVIITIIIIAIILFISISITKCIADSNLPDWLKLWLITR